MLRGLVSCLECKERLIDGRHFRFYRNTSRSPYEDVQSTHKDKEIDEDANRNSPDDDSIDFY